MTCLLLSRGLSKVALAESIGRAKARPQITRSSVEHIHAPETVQGTLSLLGVYILFRILIFIVLAFVTDHRRENENTFFATPDEAAKQKSKCGIRLIARQKPDATHVADSVLPPCPMNSRHSVIPPRNNRKHEADPSPQFSSNRPISECKSIEKAGLAGMIITGKSARISLHVATAPAMSVASKSIAAGRSDGVWVIEGLAKR